jgi:4-amino-4-deoxy-L-arabinose transferase-like glycosyltransferase
MIITSIKDKIENFLIFILLFIVYFIGLFIPLNDNDSAHHATIALNMFLNNNPVDLISHGEPYLDKPHFQFWLVQLSFMFFGVTTFAYKISSLLFTILTLYSTYKLTKLIFNPFVARNAVLIIATSFAFLLGNVDVRMDAMLTGAVTYSVYKLIQYLLQPKWKTLIFAALGVAIAFSIKGIFGVGIIGLIVCAFAFQKGIMKQLFYLKFLSVIPLFFVFISPVLYAYYLQFDLHPELVIRGTTGNSGVRFILFDQSFARMNGEEFGEASSNDYFFFFHTLLWSIIPWSLLYCLGVFNRIKKSFQEKKLFSDISLAFVYPIWFIFFIMGFSKFKLPHYMLPTYPFTAIFLAYWLQTISVDAIKKWNIAQNIQYALLILAGIILNYFAFPVERFGLTFLYTFIFFIVILKLRKSVETSSKLVNKGVFVTILFWIAFNSNFFHHLLSYQAGQTLAIKSKELKIEDKNLYLFGELDTPYSFDFYSKYIHQFMNFETLEKQKNENKTIFLYIEEKDLKILQEKKYNFKILAKQKDYRITRLTGEFINPRTRNSVLSYVYLVKVF